MGLIMEVEREMFVGLIQGIHVDKKSTRKQYEKIEGNGKMSNMWKVGMKKAVTYMSNFFYPLTVKTSPLQEFD